MLNKDTKQQKYFPKTIKNNSKNQNKTVKIANPIEIKQTAPIIRTNKRTNQTSQFI